MPQPYASNFSSLVYCVSGAFCAQSFLAMNQKQHPPHGTFESAILEPSMYRELGRQ
jgi:hypothetical protein